MSRSPSIGPATDRDVNDAGDGAPHRGQVVVIALDAADATLLCQGMDDGTMPNLAALRDGGAWGDVTGPKGFGSGAAWVTFATGLTPARHGRYFYRRVVPGSYEAQPFRGEDLSAPSFAEVAGAAGRRVAVIDVPSMPVVTGINGISVADWITHDLVYQELRTSPPELAAELIERFGANPVVKCDRPGGRTLEQHRELYEQLVARVDQKRAANRDLYGREPWDLFVTTFAEPHCVGHQSWHVRDPGHPLHDPPPAGAEPFDPVVGVYRAIDAAIGDLVEVVPPEATVLVVSATGMGPNFTGNMVLDEILRRRDGVAAPARVAAAARGKRWAKRVLPSDWRRRFRPAKRRVEEHLAVDDRARRPAFAVPHNDITGAVRLNIVGREASGVLRRGAEVDAYVDGLREDLLALRNLDTDRPVVREVLRVSDDIAGEALDELPDLFVVWERESYPDRVGSDRIGEVRLRHRGNRTGDHLDRHLFVARGPGVHRGRHDGVHMTDFAATVASILGVEMPGTDGAPIGVLNGTSTVG